MNNATDPALPDSRIDAALMALAPIFSPAQPPAPAPEPPAPAPLPPPPPGPFSPPARPADEARPTTAPSTSFPKTIPLLGVQPAQAVKPPADPRPPETPESLLPRRAVRGGPRKPLELPDPQGPPVILPAAAPVQPPPTPSGGERRGTQVRRVAYLFPAAHAALLNEVMDAIDAAAVKLSKKPLRIERTLVLVLQGSESSDGIASRVRASGAVAAILVTAEAGSLRRLEGPFEAEGVKLRALPPDDATRRPAVIDLLIDLMLLG